MWAEKRSALLHFLVLLGKMAEGAALFRPTPLRPLTLADLLHGLLGCLPGADAALDVPHRGKPCVLRGLHRHRAALAEGAVEQEPLAGRFGFNGLITLSVNVVLKLINCELLIANYAFDEIAN